MAKPSDAGPTPRLHHKLELNKGVCHLHCGLAINIKKYLKAKEEELWKLKYFTKQSRKYNLQTKSSKRNQINPSRYHNNSK